MSTDVIPGLPATPQQPASVQPGGGMCMSLELAWGRLRRLWLRACRPAYLRRMETLRQGNCPNCSHQVLDPRDLKYQRNVCGFWWRPEDDPFAWRGRLGFARYGLAELLLFSVALITFGGLFAALALRLHPFFWVLTAAALVVWGEIIWFFRDPERVIPADAGAFVSPADGTVTNVEEVDEPDFGRALRISIFLSIFNVHVNRTPCGGTVTQVRYFPGAFLDARNPDSAARNEQLWIDIEEAGTGRRIRVKQITGAIARRIVCRLKPGDVLARGERFGMIKFGSRTDLLIPVSAAPDIRVKVGDKVRGGATILLSA
jgi:phosphatidylserine decarboxylase